MNETYAQIEYSLKYFLTMSWYDTNFTGLKQNCFDQVKLTWVETVR